MQNLLITLGALLPFADKYQALAEVRKSRHQNVMDFHEWS